MKKTFKKIVTVFTKLNKLMDILIEVQRGLIVCKTCLQAVKDGVKANAKVQKTLDNLLKYAESASDAIGTVLEWFGRDGDVCTAEPRGLADEELSRVTNDIRGLLK